MNKAELINIVETLKNVITTVRIIRSEYEVHSNTLVPVEIRSDNSVILSWIKEELFVIKELAKSDELPVLNNTSAQRKPATVMGVVNSSYGPIEVHLNLKGIISAEKENLRLEKEVKRIDKELSILDKKLSSESFVERAPSELVLETRKRRDVLIAMREKINTARSFIDELR